MYEDSSNKSSDRVGGKQGQEPRPVSRQTHKVSAVCLSLPVNTSTAVQKCITDGELQLANDNLVSIIAGG